MSTIQETPSDTSSHMPISETDLTFDSFSPLGQLSLFSEINRIEDPEGRITEAILEITSTNSLHPTQNYHLFTNPTLASNNGLPHETPRTKDFNVSTSDSDSQPSHTDIDTLSFVSCEQLIEHNGLLPKMRLLFIEAVNQSEKDKVASTFSQFLDKKGLDPEEFFRLLSSEKYKRRHAWLIGVFHEYGIATTRIDLKEAFKFYSMTSDIDDIFGQVSLGNCYHSGKGTQKDLAKAFHYYKLTAERGSDRGQCNLGLCYSQGLGTEKNEFEAFYWFKKSAENGNTRAQATLGYYYEHGIGTVQDLKCAFYWYEKSALGGWPTGQFNCAYCHLNGHGTPKDERKAFELCQHASNGGSNEAFYMLGYFYLQQIGTKRNERKAFQCYFKSAQGGHIDGKHAVADFYRYGLGIEKDLFKSINWYRRATKSGSSTSSKGLGDLFHRNVPE